MTIVNVFYTMESQRTFTYEYVTIVRIINARIINIFTQIPAFALFRRFSCTRQTKSIILIPIAIVSITILDYHFIIMTHIIIIPIHCSYNA